MEDADKGSPAEEIKPAQRWGGEFMSTVRRLIKGPEEEADDEEESLDTKQRQRSLFSRFFKRLFPQRQTIEPVPPRPDSKPLGTEGTTINTQAEAEAPNENQAIMSGLPPEGEPARPKPAGTPPVNTIQPEMPLAAELADHELNIDTPIVESQSARTSADRETPLGQGAQISEQVVYERRPQPKAERVTVNRVDRSPLALALIGLEYFGRKRADRRLQTEDRRIKKSVANVEKRLELQEQSQQQLEQLAKRSQDQARDLRQKRSIYEQQLVSESKITTGPRSLPESRPPIISTSETLPHPPATDIETPIKTVVSQAETVEPRTKQPEAVFREVARAAEKNVPIERAYERRHEVKDQTSGPSSIGGPASIGVIMSQMQAAERMQSALSGASPSPTSYSIAANDRPASDGDLYRQAAQRGFWGGVVIIIFGLLALWLY